MTKNLIAALFDLSGQVALVTGGSRGLGLQMARALGHAGASVILSSRKAVDLQQATDTLRQEGIDVDWIAADCSSEDDIERLVDETLRRRGHIDILVNNAGATWGAPAEDYPTEGWDKVMNLNVRGYFLLSRAVARKAMIASGRGRIINIASVAAFGGNPAGMNMIAYNTSKAAVVNFTRALACEWGRHGVRVNAICPGFFPSKLTKDTLASFGEDNLAGRSPLMRLGDDEDLMGATLLLAGQGGKHITGQALVVDGGVSAVMG